MLRKIARKRSGDPLQESLRQNKDSWNSEVSELIGELISLKRGINGKEDPDAGIPASSIKNPFPQEIDRYLSETSNHSSRIFEFGRRIIDQQSEYSRSRNKFASWWGSRMYSEVNLFFKAEKKERQLRVRLFKSAAKLDKKLKKFESHILDYRNPLSVPFAISSLTDLILNFVSEFLPNYLLLRDLLNALDKKTVSEKKKESEEINDEEKEKQQESGNDKPNISEPSAEEQINISDIQKQGPAISAIVLYLKNKLQGNELKELQFVYNKFSKLNAAIVIISGKTPEEKLKIKEDDFIKSLKEEYKKLFSIFEKVLGKTNKKFDIEQYIKKISEDDKNKGAEQYITLLKQAAFSFNNFLNKKLLSISDEPIKKLKLDLATISAQCREYFDTLMNSLEDVSSSIEELNRPLNPILQSLYNSADRMDDISKIYNQEIRRKIREKHHYIKEIKESDIRQLLRAKERLVPYLFEVW